MIPVRSVPHRSPRLWLNRHTHRARALTRSRPPCPARPSRPRPLPPSPRPPSMRSRQPRPRSSRPQTTPTTGPSPGPRRHRPYQPRVEHRPAEQVDAPASAASSRCSSRLPALPTRRQSSALSLSLLTVLLGFRANPGERDRSFWSLLRCHAVRGLQSTAVRFH